MSDDTPLFGAHDRTDDVEALLRELETSDAQLTAPPAELWAGIDAAISDERAASTVSLADRRSKFSTRFLAAAAAIAVLTAGVVVVNSLRNTDSNVVASAVLVHDPQTFDPLGADATATARLVENDGSYEIRLDDAVLPDPQANDLELWLIATDADGEISDVQPVALVDAARPGTYTVPTDLNPDVYSIVDISIEPRDGDEAHSGRSILRGTLDV